MDLKERKGEELHNLYFSQILLGPSGKGRWDDGHVACMEKVKNAYISAEVWRKKTTLRDHA
jgi:hypothetical protein